MSGSGRGRGWLRLGQNAAPIRPGAPGGDSNQNDQLLPVPDEQISYDDLISLFQILSVDDDGITLNHKLNHLRTEFMNMCPSVSEIGKAVKAIHAECLKNEGFSEKFVLFISSAHFQNKQSSKPQMLWRDTIKTNFIQHLQDDFENSENLRRKNPSSFYNGLKLCSSFLYNARKCQSRGYPSLEKIAVTGYFDLLLKFIEPIDIRMITHLVCQNSAAIIEMYDQKYQPFMLELDKLKLKIVSENSLPPKENIVLFFAYDLITHRYDLTADELLFYRRNMNEEDYIEISTKFNSLYKPEVNSHEIINRKKSEEHRDQSLEESRFDHSLLPQSPEQRSFNLSEENTSSSSATEKSQVLKNSMRPRITNDLNHSLKYKNNMPQQNGTWECSIDDQIIKPIKSINFNDTNDFNKQTYSNNPQSTLEKVGRPILGVGARLKRT